MQDQYGNHVIAASSTALAAYERAVDAQLHAWPGVQAALDEALAESPDFALAHGLQALVHAVHGRGAQACDLDACVQDRVRLGGSHAQRDVVELTRDALRVPQAQMP